MNAVLKSPKIIAVTWGEMVVEGIGKGRDFKLWPGGGREWNWAETGTHHDPGIQPQGVKEPLSRGSTVLVLTRGMALRLKLAPKTTAFLKTRGIPYHFEETRSAVERYNRLAAQGAAVGGLFHSTC
ncbi:MAG: hypothetical protein JRJ54_02715 [Deltaproteobacteria bacterium]|nr:hypothetical protein [Deltaproteobacteria bacterium]